MEDQIITLYKIKFSVAKKNLNISTTLYLVGSALCNAWNTTKKHLMHFWPIDYRLLKKKIHQIFRILTFFIVLDNLNPEQKVGH